MKTLLAAGTAALLFGAAAPAVSQAHSLEQVKRMSSEITAGLRDGSLTKKEGETLRLQLINAEVVENHDSRRGYSHKEDQDIDNRYAAVEANIHVLKVNDDRVVMHHHVAHHRKPVHHKAVVHKAAVVH